MKLNKSQEELLRQALREAFEVRQTELLRNDDSPPLSPDFKDRLKAQLAQTNAPPKRVPAQPRCKRLSVRIALVAAILAITMLFCGTAAVACPLIRERIVRLFQKEDVQRGNTHYTAVVEGAERRAFDISAYYTLSEVPEDFVPIVSREEPYGVDRMWMKSDSTSGAKTYIFFSQIPLNAHYILSTEGCTKETVTLHGHEATLYTKPGEQTLVWYTEECMFVLGFWGTDTQKLDVFALADTVIQCKLQSIFSPIV